MPFYVLSPEADADLGDILAYTYETWGLAQARTYVRGLQTKFERLADQPGLGRARPELGAGIMSFAHEAHVVFYRMRTERLEIVRVLHKSRDVTAQF